jgi:hypothetical protein
MGRRKSLVRPLAAALAMVWLMASPTVRADQPPSLEEELEQQLREGASKLMEAIEIIIRSIPIYGPPRIDEDGNIVIPRRRPQPSTPEDEQGKEPDEDAVESTAT